MKFKEMQYIRPDIEEVKDNFKGLIEKLEKAVSYEDVRQCYLEADAYTRHMASMQTLVHIRHSIDTRSVFYDEENKWWAMTLPQLSVLTQQYTKLLLNNPFRKQLENEFGSVAFKNAELEFNSFKEEIIEDLQKENLLKDAYSKELASAQIPFKGGIYTISQLSPFKNSTDDEERLEAWKAEGSWYKQHQSKLDEIYDNLVKVRDKMGKALGYDNYLGLGYNRMKRNCYGKEEIETFRKAVVKYIVPLCETIYKDNAKRLGFTYPLSFADAILSFRSGNPKPAGNPDEILQAGKKFYDELSPETSEFFNKMLDMEMLDVLSTEGKQAGGYCTPVFDAHMPFIFANFNGTAHDVEVISHEAGHAFEVYLNIDRVPSDCCFPSMEAAEVHSMSMEFFADEWAEDFFKDDAKKYLYTHLADGLTFIPYGCLVDHFQHNVYEHPEWTPRQRHDEWKRLLEIYMPWMKLDGEIPFYADGEGWQRQTHIYTSPLYYIDYCLARTVSLVFWSMIQNDREDAWNHYMAYTKEGGGMTFLDLLKCAGLPSPFDENCLKEISEKAYETLQKMDLKGIE